LCLCQLPTKNINKIDTCRQCYSISPHLQVLEKRFIIYKNKHPSLLLPLHQLRIKILREVTHAINAIKYEPLASIRQTNKN
jgi:hypothetical protein